VRCISHAVCAIIVRPMTRIEQWKFSFFFRRTRRK
jgi:hypothetical protein